ncbi:sulfite exporter TauE/SafE family protein [Alkalihalobacillus sp. CinArs1]|uniref:sulfite exporter TauE/SafE family protein n=1 Tax=Alkalihalobacillus sp. CinArs1 TaxID=2995314 RepID=UPI0022DE5D7D|nr:sulfite exporter TauE/SafE family protein [Alkalihalobacillus sp. CinArs1]
MLTWVLLFFIGLAAGTIGSLVGLGGGIIIVPGLLIIDQYTNWLPELSPQLIVGSSIVVLVAIGLSSTLSYMKKKTVDYKSGGLFFLGSGPGAIAGAWLNKFIAVDQFSVYFGVFMVLVSILLMVRGRLRPLKLDGRFSRSITDLDGNASEYRFSVIAALVVSFIVGILSGLFGIGGGSLMVPAMILLFGFPTSIAVATSMFMIFLSSIIGTMTHLALGNIAGFLLIGLVPGAWIGAKCGSFINQKLSDNTIVVILRWMLILVGIRLVWQGMTG